MFPRPKIRLTVLICANIAVPLIIGATIYILSNDSTLISHWVRFVCPVQIPVVHPLPFIRNWGCDFLWAYSLAFSLLLFWPQSPQPRCTPVYTAIILSVVMEMLQLAVPAWCTFDWGDIVAQTVGSIVAAFVWRSVHNFRR